MFIFKQDLENFRKEVSSSIAEKKINYEELKARMSELENLVHVLIEEEKSNSQDLLELRQKISTEFSRVSIKAEEKERELKACVEDSISGLTKIIDKKLEVFGDKRGMVTDLLKIIAKLEGGENNVS